ncbi:hypothetical protein HD806DRAFT_431858 [Xylariaceae sp. AK1471]|nr:hypothetical protein HD806DRAFT_431858 [Xylariaceae sp. AK1471]
MTPQLHELEDAACNVIQIIKQIPDFEDSRLAVIGGLALWHYLHYYRPTNVRLDFIVSSLWHWCEKYPANLFLQNINFITNIRTNPSVLKRKLLELPNSDFSQHHQILFYQNRHGKYFQVDIRPEWHVSRNTVSFLPDLTPKSPSSQTNCLY